MISPTVLDALSFSDTPADLRALPDMTRKKSLLSRFFDIGSLIGYFLGIFLLMLHGSPWFWLQSFLFSVVFLKFFPFKAVSFFTAALFLVFAPQNVPGISSLMCVFLPVFCILFIRKKLDFHVLGFWMLLLPFFGLFFLPFQFFPIVQASYLSVSAFLLGLILLQRQSKDPFLIAGSLILLCLCYFIPFFGLSVIFFALGYLLSHQVYFRIGAGLHFFSLAFLLYHADWTSPSLIVFSLFSGLFYLFSAFRIKTHAPL